MIIGVVGRALSSASAHAKSMFGKPFFCPPPSLRVTDDQYLQILTDYIDGSEFAKSRDVSEINIAMMYALGATFPCK
jgi:hypothetical protein